MFTFSDGVLAPCLQTQFNPFPEMNAELFFLMLTVHMAGFLYTFLFSLIY